MAVSQTVLHEEVESRYLAYALSTIVSRALPDVRDGLKPVQRRIVYAMDTIGARDTARHVKSARVVGEVIGRYHPHGDAAVYEAMVRMAQDFSLRYPLLDGQGNFGSVDGDGAAAMRYTEVKLSAIAGELLADLKAETVSFRDNYDGSLTEPAVLPARIPNLLINGSSGIAVGMATNIPPHNLGEVCNALIHLIDNDEASTGGIMAHIKGPDFPTGGHLVATAEELEETYRLGKGSLKVRGEFAVETLKRGRKQLVITSIPYSVNKARLVEKIAGLILSRQLPLVSDVRDESAETVRIVLELKDGKVDPDKVMTYLYRHTEMEINFPLNFTCLTPAGVPERLSIIEILNHFLDFRKEMVVRKLEFERANLEKRLHILRGLTKIFIDLDAAIAIIRQAQDRAEAHDGLKARFDLDDEQARAILELRLHALVRLEIGKIEEELASREKRLRQIAATLASGSKIWQEVRQEIVALRKTYGDERRTAVIAGIPQYAYDREDFVVHEDVFVVITRNGWLKRVKSYDPRTQLLKEGDEVLAVMAANTRETVAFFSNFGRMYVNRVYDLAVSGKGYGDPIQTLFHFEDQERLVAALTSEAKEGSGSTVITGEETGAGEGPGERYGQLAFFPDLRGEEGGGEVERKPETPLCLVTTRRGQGFCFERSALKEPTTRNGRTLIRLRQGDKVAAVRPVEGPLLVLATARRVLVTEIDQVKVLAGAGQGVRVITPDAPGVLECFTVRPDETLVVESPKGKVSELAVAGLPRYNRGSKGVVIRGGVARIRVKERIEPWERAGQVEDTAGAAAAETEEM
ncbi:MAG TPA: DNA topoisomerase IV subunit A [Syntrophobacteria bacterium]|nr:DNA topoisomerase IV subunit A [Syntrophobacteria bacterium]